MVIGLVGTAVFFAFVLVAFGAALLKGHEILPQPTIERVDDLTLVNEDRLDRLCEDAAALGCRRVGTFSLRAGRVEGQRNQSFVTAFVAPDERTQLELQLVRTLAG